MRRAGWIGVIGACLPGVGPCSSAEGQCALLETEKLVSGDPAPSDFFGSAVAIDGDILIAGAYGNDADAVSPDTGAAYLFTRSGTAWIQQAELTAADGMDLDHFGYSVAVDGDTVIVGAYLADVGNGLDTGAAYVFARSAGTWAQQAKLVALDAADEDWFGYSVTLHGDTAVIGAHQSDLPSKADAGTAYVFHRSGSVWTQQSKLTATDGAASDYFGRAVAISGETALIGANGVDLATMGSAGAAYVFVRAAGVWSQQAKLTAADAAAFDNFGFSVALNTDSALIGSIFDDHAGGSNAGSAYVFFRTAGVWSQQAKLTASDAASSDSFGRAVAIAGDSAAVGANQDDHAGGSNAGSAYLFFRTASSWTQQAKATASDAGPSDFFGSSIATNGTSVVVGAPSDDHIGGNDAGSAYVFELRCTAGIRVTPTSGLITTEAGVTDTFEVVLNTQPTSNVTIGLSSSDATEGTVSPASLTFTSANWDIPKPVVVTGVDDALTDGDIAFIIVTDAAISSDGNYNGLNASDVSVTNTDNELPNPDIPATSAWGLAILGLALFAVGTVVLSAKKGRSGIIVSNQIG